jgi:hypothetical protein
MIIRKTKNNELEALNLWINRFLLFWILTLIIYFITTDLKMMVIMGCLPFFVGIPTFYLHIEYLYFNKDESIITNSQEKKFVVFSKKREQTYLFEDIQQINVYACPNLYENRSKFMFFENYHYAIINLKNGLQIGVTCFMVNPIVKFTRQFDGVDITYRKIFFPSIILKKFSW